MGFHQPLIGGGGNLGGGMEGGRLTSHDKKLGHYYTQVL